MSGPEMVVEEGELEIPDDHYSCGSCGFPVWIARLDGRCTCPRCGRDAKGLSVADLGESKYPSRGPVGASADLVQCGECRAASFRLQDDGLVLCEWCNAPAPRRRHYEENA